MGKRLRDGLKEPIEIPKEDLPDYMANTYRGYLLSIKQRIEIFELNKNRKFGFRELDEEFFALQVRLVMELIAFMISTFHQSTSQPIAKKKRSENSPENILSTIKALNGDFSWPNPVDPEFVFPKEKINTQEEVSVPNIKLSLCDYQVFKSIHGKLGAILHEQQRPRVVKRTITLEEIHKTLRQLKLLVFKHVITDKDGNGWYIDATMTDQPRGIGIIKITSSEYVA